jgi:acyl-CoA dehydrogenase family protein 9
MKGASMESFLEKIYQGYLDEEIFHSFRAPQASERVNSLIERFREILNEYPSRMIEEEGRVPEEMLVKMGKAGLFGISIPEAYGGLGFNLWEHLMSIEGMSKIDISVAMVSLAHLSIGAKGILLFGTEAQKQKYLVPAAKGEMIFSYALTEPQIGSDAQHIETRAELSEDSTHYILNGQKTYITNANYAGGLTVFAQLDPSRPGFMGAFIVETNREGVKVGKDMPKMGLKASSTAAIHFKDVRIPVENLIGKPGDGFKIAMTILNYGRLGLGAGSVGMMKQSLTDMKKRSSSRIQFGVPIKNFPLIQEKMVHTSVHCAASNMMNNFTAGLLEKNPVATVAMESSHCKLYGTTRCWDTLYDALQVAGGAGYLSTQPYEKRMRDFRVATVFEGTTEIHSIYPPLFMMRKIDKQLEELNGSKLDSILFLLKNGFKRVDWQLQFENRIMQKGSRLAKSNVSAIRRMLYLGLLFYGKKASQSEFFSRRITTLSLYTFGILCLLAGMRPDPASGSYSEEDLGILAYFLEEAKEAKAANNRIFDSRKERLHKRVFESLFKSCGK